MWSKPSDAEINQLPELYDTKNTPLEEKIVHMHFYMGGADWYITEYDPMDKLFIGYVVHFNDHQNAEWGYFSRDGLESFNISGNQISRDIHWKPTRYKDILTNK